MFCIYLKTCTLKQTQKKINDVSSHPLKRMEKINSMLREMRFSEGLNQNGFADIGITRRQIQRGECGNNLSLLSLFKLLDAYGYNLDEFFNGME